MPSDCRFGDNQVAPLIAFAQEPKDIRTACVVVVESDGEPANTVVAYRETGAPIVLRCRPDGMEFWKQGREAPECLESVRPAHLSAFFKRHKTDFAPEAVYRAKTLAAVAEKHCQLDFVDVGLMPLVERELVGKKLSDLIERCVREVKGSLYPKVEVSEKQGHWLFKSVFWLVAAKILRDKSVPGFRQLNLRDPQGVLEKVARHYGSDAPWPLSTAQRAALSQAAGTISSFAHLGLVSTESLAYVYENTLISDETRSALGIHSTPAYLVDYIVWQLAPWIEDIPVAKRVVFEPACGHAAFLISAMRVLRVLPLPNSLAAPEKRHNYFKERLHGIDCDAFALEIARLELTLADIPNPNGWDLHADDMFAGDALEKGAKRCMILLANPPFENFKRDEKDRYAGLSHTNKTAEVLSRTLPHLKPGAVFGVVVPQGLLHSANAAPLRERLVSDFEFQEICLFPDKVFAFSDMESAVLIGRRKIGKQGPSGLLRYRRVRERDARRFKESYAVTTERVIPQERFANNADCNMRVPDLEDVWLWCQVAVTLSTISETGQGLVYKGQGLPRNAVTVDSNPFEDGIPGYATVDRGLMIHQTPKQVFMNVERAVIRRPGTGVQTGVAQVLLNYAPVSRGPWRLKALIDREGHAVTSRFVTVRPRDPNLPLEFIWALCNSPFANAYVYAHTMKRDILVGLVRELPVPHLTVNDIEQVVITAKAYLDAVTPPARGLAPEIEEDRARDLLMRMDAEILRLYELPPRYERELLDLFNGIQRPGVPFPFTAYFPQDFEPCISLHEYLSEEYQRSTAGALRDRYEPVRDPMLLAALRRASEDFKD